MARYDGGNLKVLGICNTKNGVAFWRTVMPLMALRRTISPDLEYNFAQSGYVDLVDIMDADCVVFTRSSCSENVEHAITAKELGKKVILDVDDAIWATPKSNPVFGQFNAEPFVEMINIADKIWCSTPEIKSAMKSDKAKVVANAIDEHLFPYNGQLNDSNAVYWRGSDTHDGDVGLYKNKIEHFVNENGFDFHTFGTQLAYLTIQNPVHHHQWRTFPMYVRELKRIKPKYALIPLEPHYFNKAKSNIAALEALMVGALPLTFNKDLLEFDKVSISIEDVEFNETDKEKYLNCIQAAREKFSLAAQNKIRAQDLFDW